MVFLFQMHTANCNRNQKSKTKVTLF